MSACVRAPEGWWPHGGGYMRSFVDGRWVLWHRWLWEQDHGRLPRSWCVHHDCRVKWCGNLAHLEAMTIADHNALHAREDGHHNDAKIRCPRGHSYSGSNLLIYKRTNGRPYRVCRECKNANARRVYAS